MKKEYDFSNGERGKFHNIDGKFKLPIYLDEDLQEFFLELAKKKNTNISTLINETIKSQMKLSKSLQ